MVRCSSKFYQHRNVQQADQATVVIERYYRGITKAGLVTMLRELRDDKISEAALEVITGRKWKSSETVKEAE